MTATTAFALTPIGIPVRTQGIGAIHFNIAVLKWLVFTLGGVSRVGWLLDLLNLATATLTDSLSAATATQCVATIIEIRASMPTVRTLDAKAELVDLANQLVELLVFSDRLRQH